MGPATCTFSLISISVLDRLGCRTYISSGKVYVTFGENTILSGTLKNNLYHFDQEFVELISGDQDSDSAVRKTESLSMTPSASGLNCLEERIGDLICAVRGVHLAHGSDGSPTQGTAAGRYEREQGSLG
jgi:hypothetical protein